MALEDVPRLIPIGEFARLGGVSIKALRLYARIGLLPPARIRPQSGYRLYDPSQFATLHRILLLKQAGLALADIGDQLPHADEPALTTIRESLLARTEEIRQQLSWVEAELRARQLGGSSATPAIVIKTVPTMNVLSMRRNIDSYEQADTMLGDRPWFQNRSEPGTLLGIERSRRRKSDRNPVSDRELMPFFGTRREADEFECQAVQPAGHA